MMTKRFTETGKWDDAWFRRLSIKKKLFWIFLCDRCDNAGIWNVDIELASFCVGSPIDPAVSLSAFNEGKERVRAVRPDKWLVVGFAEFQYGSFRKSKHAFHRKLVESIDTVSIGYQGGIDTPQEKDKEKEKKGVAVGLVVIPRELDFPDFIHAWEEFKKYRAEKKKAMTERTQTMALKHLVAMSGGVPAVAVKIIEQSIANGWQGLFELKNGMGAPAKIGARVVEGKYDHLSR